MPWPVDDLSTADLDSGADRPPRAEFFKLFQRVKTIIAARGTVSGVAALDTRRRVPDSQLGRGVAGGVAELDATGRLPEGQLPILPPPAQQVPPGTIAMHAGARPTGWLNCYGSAVSRTVYPELFAVIGTRFGAGDGSTTFNLPNLVGRFPLGLGAGRAQGDTGGEAEHTLTLDELPAHRHRIGRQAGAGDTAASTAQGAAAAAADAFTQEAGGGQAHNNMPPWLALGFIIKV